MKKHSLRLFILSCTLLCGSMGVLAQENLRSQMFSDADKILAQAKEKKADFYSPASYAKAMQYYNEANDKFARGGSLEEIRERLKNAEAYFAKSLDLCKAGEVTFAATMGARTDATSAGAQKSSPELWDKAEEQFKKAARALEENDMNNAKSVAGEAESIYRSAELEAIKANFLSPARDLLRKAEAMNVKDNAPKTLQRAQQLAVQVENLLTQKRYDTDEARQLAQEAKYEAAHAIYLHQTIEIGRAHV